jgi:copper chaperone
VVKNNNYLINRKNMFKKIILTIGLFLFSTNLFAAQTQIAQVNGMMCIKCQKMVTEALQAASPDATVKVSWPEGVAVSSFKDKSNLSDEDYKNAILGTGFEVIKVVSVEKIITDAGEARKLVDKSELYYDCG